MRTGISIWKERVAPVFDASRRLLALDVENGEILARIEEQLPETDPVEKVRKLIELRVGELVCGAISRPLHETLMAQGIRVVPFITGDVGKVIQAWLAGGLETEAFLMPGCCGPGRRRGRMTDAGRGRGNRGGAGRGQNCRGAGSASPGAGGFCVCPRCGHREVHRPGVPCVGTQCPGCGAPMIRDPRGPGARRRS